MAEKTKADLEFENSELRARVEELEQQAGSPTVAAPRRPELPSFGMSEGTRNDIEQAQNEIARNPRLDVITMNEPFTGRTITVTEDGHDIADDQPAGRVVLGDGVADVSQFEH
jgi:hypothetical protein